MAGLKILRNTPRWVYFAIFTISGFSGLIYESIWSHYLKLFLGHAAYAQSLVLVIFMGGMAIGSWLAARFTERWRNPILYYAIVEGIIGVLALVFHTTFVRMTDTFYLSLLPVLGNVTLGNALKWASAAALIMPQSVFLGMTFPLLTAGILRRYPDRPGGSLAMLYFTNSIGAAAGVLASGFWLISHVGLPGTIMTAGLLNISLALVVWALVKADQPPAKTTAAAVPTRIDHQGAGLAALFFFAAGITGAASFIYEIGWIRMLSLVLGATTHSFELMLSAFISGLALGGLWMKWRIDRIEDPLHYAGWVQVSMGILAIFTIPVYVRTFDWMASLLAGLQNTDTGYALYTSLSHGIALLVMVPTTFLAGMTLPLFTHILLRAQQGEGSIGRVYASNTLGAIAGVLFAIHIGMPLLGLKLLICFGALLDVLLGLLLLYRSRSQGHRLTPVVTAALVSSLILLLIITTVHIDPRRLASGVFRYRWAQLPESTRVLSYKDGKTASISLVAQGTSYTISTNGKPDATIEMDPGATRSDDEMTMTMLAALPLAYNPDAKQVANIGMGSGLTTHTLLADDSIRLVDTIEIEPAMVQTAMGFGHRVQRTFNDPRSRIHIEDAKSFFPLQQNTYDIIAAEPSNPWVSGVASLFSVEFYRTVPRYLKPDGVFVQWLQLYEFNDQLVHSVLKALTGTFSDVAIYNTDDTDILIVARAHGSLGTPDFNRVLGGTLGAELAQVGFNTPSDFLVRKSGNQSIIDAILTQSPIPMNSDYFPYLDLNAGRARFRNEAVTMFYTWGVTPLPVLEMLGMEPFDYAKVSAVRAFSRTKVIEQAGSLFYAFTVAPEQQLSASVRPSIVLTKLLSRSCEPIKHEDVWLHGMHALAEATLSFMPVTQATKLLDAALPGTCLVQGSARLRIWMDLYRAVATRDPERMAVTGDIALRDTKSDTNSLSYALTALMLGQLRSNHPEQVLQTWRERPEPLQQLDAKPEQELILRVAQQRLAMNTTSH